MKIRKIDAQSDIIMGKGTGSYFTENNAIAEDIQTRLMCFLNDCWFDQENGIDWFRLLGSKNTKDEIILSVRSTILASYGVVKINSLDVTTDEVTRGMTITGNINTIFSEGYPIAVGVTI